MKDYTGYVKQYVHATETWYADTTLRNEECIDDVTFGFYWPDGGTSGEMGVKWELLDGETVPCLHCYDGGGWGALAQIKDVIDAMAEVDDQGITPQDFCALLERCGFEDKTPRRRGDSYPHA